MIQYYVLDAHHRPIFADLDAVEEMFQAGDHVLQQTQVGETLISTIFLGIDHNFGPDGPPLLFETGVFTRRRSVDLRRYSTRVEALAGHHEFVAQLRRIRWRRLVNQWRRWWRVG